MLLFSGGSSTYDGMLDGIERPGATSHQFPVSNGAGERAAALSPAA
jgi:hypothetical protein